MKWFLANLFFFFIFLFDSSDIFFLYFFNKLYFGIISIENELFVIGLRVEDTVDVF